MTTLDLSHARRNAQGRLWVDAIDGADVDLDALIDDSAQQLAGGDLPPDAGDDAPTPPTIGARLDALLAHLRAASGRDIAFAIGGVVLLAIVFSAAVRGAPAPTKSSAPTAAPTVLPTVAPTPALQAAYDAPGGVLLGTIPLTSTLAYQHSGYPGWAGVAWQGGVVWVETSAQVGQLPDLAPPPTARPRSVAGAPVEAPAPAQPPACDPTVNPRYVVELDLSPIGRVRGVSCESQAEAAANADALRAAMLATADAADEPAPTPSAR
jgi:hypothetical protein